MGAMELDLDNLTALRILGRGATGTVFLVTDRSSSDSPPFALKVIDKLSPSSKADADRRARWELTVLSRLSHPFLPSLLGSLDTPSLLAYALPFCPAGDLNALRHSLSDHIFSTSAIRFYLSELLLAISHLHSLSIVYRDLKPENVLIAADGHVVLTDFDLSRHMALPLPQPSPRPSPLSPPPRPPSHHRRNLTRLFGAENIHHHLHDRLKKVKSARVSPVSRRRSSVCGAGGRSNSFVGTEEYVAPEIVRGDGHDFAVDFWALGILAYEMAYGRTPFKGKSRKETFRNVLVKSVEFAGRQRTELTDLIGKLLAKDPSKRLGSFGGAEEVMRHEFFKGVRWELLTEVSRPPYFASAEELEEAVRVPPGDEKSQEGGFDIREYFEKIRSPVTAPSDSSFTEF